MTSIRVKICGLTRFEDAAAAIDFGADALGFIFGYPKSPRNLSFEKLAELVKRIPPYVSTVVVTPALSPGIDRVLSEIAPSFLQIHYNGDEISARTFSKHPNVINTVHVGSGSDNDMDSTMKLCREFLSSGKGILLDSLPRGETKNSLPGGTGLVHDWRSSRMIRDALYPFPVILGGGLNPENVRRAAEAVKPFAVDVSSGVESSPGVKDRAKVQNFIANAKSARYD